MKRFDSFFQDNTGKYITAQPPNVPLIMITISLMLFIFIPIAELKSFFQFLLQCSLFLWSYLEIRFGESPFRRVLGGMAMAGLVILHVITIVYDGRS